MWKIKYNILLKRYKYLLTLLDLEFWEVEDFE